jgi:hypothetical protein
MVSCNNLTEIQQFSLKSFVKVCTEIIGEFLHYKIVTLNVYILRKGLQIFIHFLFVALKTDQIKCRNAAFVLVLPALVIDIVWTHYLTVLCHDII